MLLSKLQDLLECLETIVLSILFLLPNSLSSSSKRAWSAGRGMGGWGCTCFDLQQGSKQALALGASAAIKAHQVVICCD
jgi:hypothetical protein